MKKAKEIDYSNENRPENRRAQFFDIFKHRFVEILKLSLLQAVFSLPLLVAIILFYSLIRNSTDINSLMTVFLIQGGLFIFVVPIAFIGLTGSFYSIKKIAYSEGEYASSSFFIGLREEWKRGLLIGIIAGISSAVAVIGFFFANFYISAVNTVISGLAIAVLVIQLIVVLIVCYYSIAQAIIYINNLRFVFKNSFIMALIRFHINLFCIILHPGILIALCCIMEITMYIGVVLYIFISAFGHLLWMMNLLGAFDKFINKENHPEEYRKGLKIETEEA